MATTTNYSWVTPDDTSLVKDGASAIRTLGSSVDTTVKALNPGTTAGDLDYYTAATTKARIAKGTAGQVFTMNSGATAPEWAAIPSSSPANDSAIVATQESTTTNTYTNLTTNGPAVTITTGTKALVIISSELANSGSTNESYVSYAVSGATTIAATDANCIKHTNALGERQSSAQRLSTLTAGSNTFTMKYRVNTGTGYFSNREIIVINLGS
jgi:hypothetical protein